MTNLVAAPVMANAAMSIGANAPSVKSSVTFVSIVALVIASALNSATPATASLVAPAIEVAEVVAVTVDVSPVTVLPPESTTSMMGCGVKATAFTAPAGCGGAAAKASFAAAPTVTVIVAEVVGAAESVASVKVSVYEPTNSFNPRFVKVAT